MTDAQADKPVTRVRVMLVDDQVLLRTGFRRVCGRSSSAAKKLAAAFRIS